MFYLLLRKSINHQLEKRTSLFLRRIVNQLLQTIYQSPVLRKSNQVFEKKTYIAAIAKIRWYLNIEKNGICFFFFCF